jgi:putative ABC transport system ATP-binding protein
VTLRAKGVSYRYPRAEVPALDDVDLVIPAGATTAVVGLSGSGKTTLLSLLGLLWEAPPERGALSYHDGTTERVYAGLSASARAELRRRHFGFVLQSSYLLPHFSCAQNVGLPLALAGRPARERRERVHALLREADDSGTLYNLRDVSAREVSGGERQRMAVLRAVIHNPAVLFADEPLSNLDFRNAGRILDLLKRWQGNDLHADDAGRPRTLVLVSHSTETAYREAEHFILLRRGRVVLGRTLTRADLPGGAAQIHQLIDDDPKES